MPILAKTPETLLRSEDVEQGGRRRRRDADLGEDSGEAPTLRGRGAGRRGADLGEDSEDAPTPRERGGGRRLRRRASTQRSAPVTLGGPRHGAHSAGLVLGGDSAGVEARRGASADWRRVRAASAGRSGRGRGLAG